MNNVDPTISALGSVAAQIGIAIVFILAWQNERKERQALNDKLQETQTAHRAEMMEIIKQQFGLLVSINQVLASLHLEVSEVPPNGKLPTNP